MTIKDAAGHADADCIYMMKDGRIVEQGTHTKQA